MDHYVNEQFMDNPAFPFRAFRAPVTQDFELHIHDFVEIIYVTEGRGIHLFQDRAFPVREGDIFIIHRHVPHGYKRLPNTPFTVNNVIFDPGFFDRELAHMAGVTAFVDFYYVEPFLRERSRSPAIMNLGKPERIEAISILDRLVREDAEREAHYELMARTHLLQLFVYLSRCCDRWAKKPAAPVRDEEELLRMACAFTKRHYAQPIGLEQISRMCGLSQTTFTTKFKRHLGLTFIEYRNRVRLEEAKTLLETSPAKIMAVALEVGFEDLSFFNRLFKREFGLTPSEHRERFRRAARLGGGSPADAGGTGARIADADNEGG
ncbi:AraC family transcriptional regulator, L-rhamnose operon regulatory protein RhaS [Paenibacillus sp. UNC496MF]|uniref:AraC family transcriptional regulator n=1 Tax=Paenibacillus sp. UNC496MF TaxID=1502753 RepID=UPI0008E25DD9|nr:AraC family transcriptional regulator [Paenibacillus sp. UNC496MF]SFJ01579.1 AraC family transcriptional regulator, L-rhamnose operon regulatory protein RhaS [Paenibacillus sp. UNC496MF]